MPKFHKINTMGKVSVMEDGDIVLLQWRSIQDCSTSKFSKLSSHSAKEQHKFLHWIFFEDCKVLGIAGPLWFKMKLKLHPHGQVKCQ